MNVKEIFSCGLAVPGLAMLSLLPWLATRIRHTISPAGHLAKEA